MNDKEKQAVRGNVLDSMMELVSAVGVDETALSPAEVVNAVCANWTDPSLADAGVTPAAQEAMAKWAIAAYDPGQMQLFCDVECAQDWLRENPGTDATRQSGAGTVCVYCNAILGPVGEVRYTLGIEDGDPAQLAAYLGFGSRVFGPAIGPYRIIQMQARSADWQRGRLQSGMRGGAELWFTPAMAAVVAMTIAGDGGVF